MRRWDWILLENHLLPQLIKTLGEFSNLFRVWSIKIALCSIFFDGRLIGSDMDVAGLEDEARRRSAAISRSTWNPSCNNFRPYLPPSSSSTAAAQRSSSLQVIVKRSVCISLPSFHYGNALMVIIANCLSEWIIFDKGVHCPVILSCCVIGFEFRICWECSSVRSSIGKEYKKSLFKTCRRKKADLMILMGNLKGIEKLILFIEKHKKKGALFRIITANKGGKRELFHL